MTPRALVLLASVACLAQASLASAQTAVTSSGQGPMVVERVSDGPAIMPEVKITELDKITGTLVGASGGWMMDNRFLIGGAGYWLVNGDGRSLGYGGLMFQWLEGTERRLGFSARGLIGGGWATLPQSYTYLTPVGPTPRSRQLVPTTVHVWAEDGVFIAEPEASLLVNVAPRMRLNLGVGYRFVGADWDFDHRLHGVTATIGFQVGGSTSRRQ
jgi:hypothetical protein